MADTLQDKPTLATQLYGLVAAGQPRQMLDYLIDHPDVRIDSTALQAALQFPQHKDVALAAYSIGESAAALGLKRPWTEGQLGYAMNAETADLLAQAGPATRRSHFHMPDYGRPIEFGIFLDPAAAQFTTVLDTITLIDQLGFDWIGIQDHPYNRQQLDAMTLIGMGLARTERVRFFPDVATLSLRPPTMLANQAVTLDLLGNGRFELGLGSGAYWDAIVAMGGPRRSPGDAYASMDEAIDILRAAFDGARSVDHDGAIYQIHGWRPGPAPAHRIGIWLGVTGPRALGLTGRKADGWIPSLAYVPPAAARNAMETIDGAATSAGRNPADIRRVYNIWGGFTDAPPAPIDETSGEFSGSPTAWTAFLTHLATAVGFDTFLFGIPSDPDLLRTIAAEIVPAVREQVDAVRS